MSPNTMPRASRVRPAVDAFGCSPFCATVAAEATLAPHKTQTCGIYLPTNNHLSNLQARTKLDHAVGRDVEVVGDVGGVARHGGEQALAPARHGRRPAAARHD